MGKLWGDMNAAERLSSSVGYLEYNYGVDHPYAKAARASDLVEFRRLTRHVTEMADVRITGIVDARDPQQVTARAARSRACRCGSRQRWLATTTSTCRFTTSTSACTP